MNLMDLFTYSKIEDIALILRCLLDRIPMVIIGSTEEEIEEVMNEISILMPFRNTLIFYTDFVEHEDYREILDVERLNLKNKRNIFLCYPFAVEKLRNQLNSFKSWIIGILQRPDLEEYENQIMSELLTEMKQREKIFLQVDLDPHSIKTILHIQERNPPDLKFEKWLYQNAINHTEIAVEKMKRVISKRIIMKLINEDQFASLMNFSVEEKDLKENKIKREISNFYQACNRSFSILNRLENLRRFGFPTQISSMTLLTTIAYTNASVDRITEFIAREWNLHYDSLLQPRKIGKLTNILKNLWR